MSEHFDGLLSNLNPALKTDHPGHKSEDSPSMSRDDVPAIFSFRIPLGLRRAIKRAAHEEDRMIQEYMEDIIRQHLEKIGQPYTRR